MLHFETLQVIRDANTWVVFFTATLFTSYSLLFIV